MRTEFPPALAARRAALEGYFAALPPVQLACLFGSHARGQAGPLSDIDIAVLLDRSVDPVQYLDVRLDIIGRLMQLFNTNGIDVVILNQAPLALRYRVVRDGVLAYCRKHDVMIQFIARTVNEYLDFKPVIERHERAILDRARKGELLNGYNPHHGALERYRQLRERAQGTAKTDV